MSDPRYGSDTLEGAQELNLWQERIKQCARMLGSDACKNSVEEQGRVTYACWLTFVHDLVKARCVCGCAHSGFCWFQLDGKLRYHLVGETSFSYQQFKLATDEELGKLVEMVTDVTSPKSAA